MAKRYEINAEQAAEIAAVRKGIRDKNADRRLHAVQLRGEGMKNGAVAAKLDADKRMVSAWVRLYAEGGIEALLPKKRGGNRRNLTYEQEAAVLEPFLKAAQAGQVVETKAIKNAYMQAIGRELKGHGQIYNVLARHNWRMVMPRSKHPKQADEATQEASKKLTSR
jgi:transposase